MIPPVHEFADFRRQALTARATAGPKWEASRRLIEKPALAATLQTLTQAIAGSEWPGPLKEALVQALTASRTMAEPFQSERLKQITGLPATKALRALCVLLDVVPHDEAPTTATVLTPSEIEAFLRSHENPFDLFLASSSASLLDLGAGDLSFAEAVAARYGPLLSQRKIPLLLDCIDRLNPASQLGGPLHPEPGRLQRLRTDPHIRFRYLPDQDMFEIGRPGSSQTLSSRYSIVTCWAPATPTFAYEPTRVAHELIQEDLRRTKGSFRMVRLDDGERALEVRHQGRSLLFPPWKFDIRGPLALLQFMAMRASLCVLGAVDTQVFWEVLAQLMADTRARSTNRLFTEDVLPETFGEVYRRLSRLAVGDSLSLGDVTELRRALPDAFGGSTGHPQPVGFRYVGIRRGAVFPGIPASSTAKMFDHMKEERPPWFLTVIPEVSTTS